MDGRITSVSHQMYKAIMLWGRQICIQPSHKYLHLIVSRLKFLLQSWNNINHQVLIIIQHSFSKKEVMHYILRATNVLVLLWIKKNYNSNGKNLLLYLPIYKNGDKTDCSNYRGNYEQNVTQYSCLKVKSKQRWNYWRSLL
jgi:hypothetical protein